MSYPVAVQFNGVLLQAEHDGTGHVLRRFIAQDLTPLLFTDGAAASTIYSDSEAQPCGLTVDESTGLVLADIPTSGGLVTRQSNRFGEPDSWTTIGT